MYDPSMRVLTVLEILQAKERVTAAELAARLEVSDRTVQRYVARLQDLGVPVRSTRGRGASYRLRPGFRLPPIMLSGEEAFAVALGLSALEHVGLTALAPAVVGVSAKLERVLPAEIWGRMQALCAALQLEKQGWVQPVDAALVTKLASAIEGRLEVEMEYENHQRTLSQRTVQPLGLVRDGEVWFLAAHCLLRQDLRLFRVERIASARLTRTAFARPAGFDAREFTSQRLQQTPGRWTTEVRLEATPETLRYDLLPPRVSVAAADGGVLIRCNVNDLEAYAAKLLELGHRFEVHSPPELRLAFRSVARRAARVASKGRDPQPAEGGPARRKR